MLGVKTCHAARTCCAGRVHWRSASQSVRGPGPARRYGMQGLARWLHAWRWRTWQCLVWPPTRWGALLWRHMVYCNIPNKFWSKCIDLWTSTPKASLKYLPFNSYPCCQIKLPVINWTLLSEIHMKLQRGHSLTLATQARQLAYFNHTRWQKKKTEWHTSGNVGI